MERRHALVAPCEFRNPVEFVQMVSAGELRSHSQRSVSASWVSGCHVWGEYDVPGWTANGVEPWGVQMDPIAADGMLFYKGFFLVLLGIRSMVADAERSSDRWNEPFEMIRDGVENTFEWTHTGIAEHLCRQWMAAPIGCH